MRRFLVDLNVVLDVLLERKPHAEAASALWAAVEQRRAEWFLPAHGFTTIHYLARRQRDSRFAQQVLADLTAVFRVAAVDEGVIRRAAGFGWADFEDAVCAAAAQASGCEAVVTRNLEHFEDSPVEAIDPTAALAWIGEADAAPE